MTGIFKLNNPSGNAILFFYALVLKIPLFLHPHPPILQASDGILYKGFLSLLSPLNSGASFIYSVVAFVLLFGQAIGLNAVINARRMHRSPNFLTGMSFLLLTSLFPEWFSLSAPMLVNALMIWIWARLSTLYNNPNPKATIFNIGLVAGLAAFFYFPSIIFLLLVIVGTAIARPFRLQEWMVGLIGILTPLYFFAAWLFLSGSSHYNFPGLRFSYPRVYRNTAEYVALALIAVALIAGIYFINVNMRRQVVSTRKSWQLLFMYLIIAAFVPFINAAPGFSYWIILAVPCAPVLAAAFLYPQKRLVPVLLHWAMFGCYVVFIYVLKSGNT